MAQAPKRSATPRQKPNPKSAARTTPVKTAGSSRSPVSSTTPLLEWIAGGIGLVLVLATIVVIGRDVTLQAPSPPSITLEVLEVRKVPAGYLATIRAWNQGERPAAGVAVEGVLTTPGRAPETAEATFDFLPAQSRREGGIYFTSDPRAGALTLRAKGYADP